ncbi:MAG: outer membrane protein assembly factor BamD [Bacteroidetes bacterium]|nr:MAG: outer membrane protein assembly factor BamD [Bacteroidota bacterium]
MLRISFSSAVRFALIPILTSTLLVGCSNSSRVRYDSPQEAYTKGMEAYENERYRTAGEYFQGVFDFGRTHEWAAESQLFLARSYRGDRQYLLAANEFGRFIQIYRSDDRVPEAEFELALTYLDRSPAYDLDQDPTEDAIQKFRLFISRNPNHQLVPEAQKRILELREKLAQKMFTVGMQYERRGLFRAAAISYESVFDNYYDSDVADDALLGALRSYYAYSQESVFGAQAERLQKAEDNYDRLLQIFPQSPVLKDAELVYEDVQRALAVFTEES